MPLAPASRSTVKTLGVLTLLLSCGGSKSSTDVRDGGVGGRGGNVTPSGGGGAAGHGRAIPYGSASSCSRENDALVACLDKNSAMVTVNGTYASCTYAADSDSGCSIRCQFGTNYAALTCSGGSGVPKQCGCAINGHVLVEGDDPPTFVNDCAEAARQAADGLCTSRIDCCIKYVDSGKDVCACVDPKRRGYESCQAMATFAQGTIVDICPQLLPDPGACWPPNSCSLTTP